MSRKIFTVFLLKLFIQCIRVLSVDMLTPCMNCNEGFFHLLSRDFTFCPLFG